MRTEPISRELQAGLHEPPTDIQMLMHAAWLLAGVAIALAGCTSSDAAVQAKPAQANENVAHLAPQAKDAGGNVQDLTY